MTKGTYTRDFYILPTIIYHNGDGIYKTLELAWLKFYIGIVWRGDYVERKETDNE